MRQGKEYAILTDELTRAWSGMTTRQYKNLKGLKKQSLRDNMSTTELTLNQLAEVATRELSQQERPEGFDANKRVAQAGGSVAGNARRDLEQRLGRPVITSANATQLNHVVTQMIEASASAADDITHEKPERITSSFLYICIPTSSGKLRRIIFAINCRLSTANSNSDFLTAIVERNAPMRRQPQYTVYAADPLSHI